MRKILSKLKWMAIGYGEVLLAHKLRMQYRNTVVRLRKYPSDRSIRVLFLVNESSKWKTQSLCDEMRRRGGYEAVIALTNADVDWRESKAKRHERMEGNRSFFKKRGFEVVTSYDIDGERAIPLSKFCPDIVFYQHPWGFPDEQMPRNVASFALTCYVPYFVPTSVSLDMYCHQPLHREVFRHFVTNADFETYYKANIKQSHYAGEVMGLGHTMLDELQPGDCPSNPDGLVIYSPHWSIIHPKLNSFLDLSTFLTNGQLILDYARKHPEVKWAFKPHPTLRITLHNTGAMSDEDIDAYYKGWEEIGEACYTGDYVDLFKRSRVMITDCDSFMSEYPCTRNPIIHLVSPVPNKRKFSPMQPLYDTYYKVHDNEELLRVLDEVVVAKRDPKREARLAALEKSGLLGTNAAKNILDHIEDLIGRGK